MNTSTSLFASYRRLVSTISLIATSQYPEQSRRGLPNEATTKNRPRNSTLFAFLISTCLLLATGVGSVSAINYYSGGNNAPNLLTSWWTNQDGTGTHPANFTTKGNVFIIQNGHTMTTTNTWTVSGKGSTIQINTGGTLVASNAVAATIMTVASGGTYQHNQDGGTIPTATWDPASNCNVTGMTATSPSGLAQTFGNFTWNCSSQTGTVATTGNIIVNGNFNLTAGTFTLNNATSYTLTIAGNYTQTGGVFDFNAGTSGSYAVESALFHLSVS